MLDKLKKNVKPLSGSILIAIILWFMVTTQKEYSYQVRVPLEVMRLAEGKILAAEIPEYAQLELQGRGQSLIAARFYDIKFNLELPEIKSSATITLQDYLNFLDLPATFGLQVSDIIEPKTIDLIVDDYWEEMKPILMAGNVGTADGYVLLGYSLEKDSVLLRGAKKLIQNTAYVWTEKLSLVDNKLSFTQPVRLEQPHPGLLEMEFNQTRISFEIQRLVERIVYDVPILISDVPRYLQVEAIPPTLSLRIKGGEKLVADVDPEDIRAQINFASKYSPDAENYAASISTPDKISWVESIPTTFKLKVKRK
jgi:hypothetical protein